MKLTKTMFSLVTSAALFVVAPAVAYAQTIPATASLAVDATVSSTCHVDTTAVHFPAYDHLATLPTDATLPGSITLNCSLGTTPTISLNQGGGGSATQRQMQHGADRLDYNLFQNSYTTAWPIDVAVSGYGPTATASVYGRIPAGQNRPEGSYTDTVVVTVVF
jgi:spore coat protein U-like protein